MELKERFADFIKRHSLFQHRTPVLLAVSGGIDSTVMCHLFNACGMNFGVAHVNFQLRGRESDEDEKFAAELATQFKVPFFSSRFNTENYAEEKKISIQMAARDLRYEWLEKTRKENGFHFIAVAHHQNDAMETVLLNMLRGTGIRGLHGIKMKQGKIVRPMLAFFKEEIEGYAASYHVGFREDQSNLHTDYDRNKIRLEIIPQIKKKFPSIEKTFSENIRKWSDAEWMYDQMIDQLKKKLMEQKDEEFFISIPKLRLYPVVETLLHELLLKFDFNSDQCFQIMQSLDSIPGKIFLSSTHRLIKDRQQLIIAPLSSESVSEILISEEDRRVNISSLHLSFETKMNQNFFIPKDDSIHCLDKKLLEFPLLVRKWKKGDYFYPFGMKRKKKKISDYLIDRKIPLHEKENIWVIESGKKIVCIAGERIDDRFRITPSTSTIFVITTSFTS